MVLLGLLALAIGGVSAMSDAHTMREIRDNGIERAVKNGCPYVVEPLSSVSYTYLPTKEKCFMETDWNTKDKVLVNQKTKEVVFNVTKWEKMKQNRDTAKKLINEAKEMGVNCFKADFGDFRTDFRTVFLFDMDSMECTAVYESFPYIGKYKMSNIITDENGKRDWINTKDISAEEFHKYSKVPWGWRLVMSQDLETRRKQWKEWTL